MDLKNVVGSENASAEGSTTTATTDLSTTVVNSDNLAESLDQQEPQIVPTVTVASTVADDSPKFDQYILDSITAAASSSSTSITSSSMTGYQNYCPNNANSNIQQNNINNSDPSHEMPQLLNILNELLDGQDISTLANSGGNGDTMHDMEDQEENYEDDSPRKDDPEEMAKVLAQQRLVEISREEQLLRRRMDFLIRRLFKLVARSTGIHVSEEMAGFLEHVARYSKKKESNMIKEKSASLSIFSSSPAKFPSYLGGGSSQSTELLTSPTFSTEPPINLLSSPSTTGNKTTQEDDDDKQSLPQIKNNNINNSNNNSNPTNNNSNNVNISDNKNNNSSNAVATEALDVIEPPKTNNIELKPVPLKEMKSFLRRIDNIATMQNTVLTKKALAFKYFSKTSPSSSSLQASSSFSSNLNSSKFESSNFSVSAIPKLEDADVDQVEQTSGLLMSEMRLIEHQIDSDATASSTGGESADEMTIYNNQYQQPLSM